VKKAVRKECTRAGIFPPGRYFRQGGQLGSIIAPAVPSGG
jgi:hypothetical protein